MHNLYQDNAEDLILIAGFPFEPSREKIQTYIDSLNVNGTVDIQINKKNDFNGRVYIKFKNSENKNLFLEKEYLYDGIQLNCKTIIKKQYDLEEYFDKFRFPCKVFIHYIPKDISKKAVEKILSEFGVIVEHTYVIKERQLFNYSFLIFETHESAKKCVENKRFLVENDHYIKVSYAKPKVSKYVLNQIKNKEVGNYIEYLFKEVNVLDPDEFNRLYENAYGNKTKNSQEKFTKNSKKDIYELKKPSKKNSKEENSFSNETGSLKDKNRNQGAKPKKASKEDEEEKNTSSQMNTNDMYKLNVKKDNMTKINHKGIGISQPQSDKIPEINLKDNKYSKTNSLNKNSNNTISEDSNDNKKPKRKRKTSYFQKESKKVILSKEKAQYENVLEHSPSKKNHNNEQRENSLQNIRKQSTDVQDFSQQNSEHFYPGKPLSQKTNPNYYMYDYGGFQQWHNQGYPMPNNNSSYGYHDNYPRNFENQYVVNQTQNYDNNESYYNQTLQTENYGFNDREHPYDFSNTDNSYYTSSKYNCYQDQNGQFSNLNSQQYQRTNPIQGQEYPTTTTIQGQQYPTTNPIHGQEYQRTNPIHGQEYPTTTTPIQGQEILITNPIQGQDYLIATPIQGQNSNMSWSQDNYKQHCSNNSRNYQITDYKNDTAQIENYFNNMSLGSYQPYIEQPFTDNKQSPSWSNARKVTQERDGTPKN